MIEAKNLGRSFATKSQTVVALRAANFRLEQGQRASIIGKSGSGKTTLLNLIAGLDRPTNGELIVDSQPLAALSRSELANYRLKTVGVVFQSYQLIPQRTVAQNVELPLILAGCPTVDRRQRVGEMLSQVGMSHRAGHYPCELSGGEQQRTAIARALIQNPKIAVADEPTGNLDSSTTTQILNLMESLFELQGTTVVMVTHDEQIARRLGTRLLRVVDGVLDEYH